MIGVMHSAVVVEVRISAKECIMSISDFTAIERQS